MGWKTKEQAHEYYLKNKERINKRNREYAKNNLTVNANTLLKKRYGITYEEYQLILIGQEYKCKICETHVNMLKIRLHVDHCHNTGKIRGLLCENCNRGLGMFKDNPKFLQKAIDYLDDNP